ncbi:hypothetical protein JH262_02000 [Xanthomonas campestris pv. incanae]|uniref:hypothetical protein n=1 Tax=Xanthomonas campestris TaxID=339 RepID=UPI0023689C0B|nr:hypothetical protein [Xanthomonas campestris]WDJ98487.1 hypothetical protein JH262_02000 [Xanthomonas campestris pv. incanae]
MKLNFGDGKLRKGDPGITPENANVFRQIVAWWLYGPNPARTANTLYLRFTVLRPLFLLCSRAGAKIRVIDLYRFPRLIDQLGTLLQPSQSTYTLTLLHDIWEHREDLGFFLLDANALARLAAALPGHEPAQTPYIPPRIWLYQVNRLRALLDDFNSHRHKIEDCFLFCLNAYADNMGSMEIACSRFIPKKRQPFNGDGSDRRGSRCGATLHGRFELTAERFGIKSLLERWLTVSGVPLEESDLGIQNLSTFFTLISYAGLAYLMNFSMMRIDEAWSLRSDCLTVERDEMGEDIYLIHGPTTKTVQDDDARWIASPSARHAIDALSVVSRLRMIAAAASPDVPTTEDDIRNPHLFTRPYEPWAGNNGSLSEPLSIRPTFATYQRSVANRLFDPEQLRMTKADVEAARLVTPSLDPSKFDEGIPWTFGWHQLRRTGAVNMNSSGVVGESSVQYQLKHATRAMSRYYGQGHYHLRFRLNESARGEYVRTMYERVAREFAALSSDRFISPYGDERKQQILNVVSPTDRKQLLSAAKAGAIPYREHLLGGCTNPTPCPFGGADSLAPCGGNGKPCDHLLYDRQKLPSYLRLKKVISSRLADVDRASPLSESLSIQLNAIEDAIYACQT